MSVNGRDMALNALMFYRKNGRHSDLALNSALSLSDDDREKALGTRIFYTVLQNKDLFDFYLSSVCSRPINQLQPQIADIMRICCAQLLFFNRIPPFSAVNEAVRQAKKKCPKASGMVNAVCRKLSSKENLPIINGSAVKRLSIKYSHPEWFVQKMLDRFISEEECEQYLSANNEIPPVYLQKNTLLSPEETDYSPFGLTWQEGLGCYTADNLRQESVKQLLIQGKLYVQDPAAAAAVFAASPKPGMTVIDVCAAPGGKSFTSAMLMQNKGEIFSFDISSKKIAALQEESSRLGITCLKSAPADSRMHINELQNIADIVFCDVPCSGFGVIRKKPEIRYKSRQEVERLPEIDLAILSNACNYVKPDGVLLYSTCTVLTEENEMVVSRFLQDHNDFICEPFEILNGICSDGMLTLFPHQYGTDGFFICKMRRKH